MNVVSILLSCVIDVYLFHLFFANYLNKRESISDSIWKEKSSQCIIISLLALCNFLGNGDVNILITPFLFYLYTLIEFKGKIRYRLLCFLTVFCILCGCEFLFMLLVRPSASAYKDSAFMMILTLAIKLLSYVLIIIINQIIGKRKRIQNQKIFAMYLMLPIASLFVMLVVFYSRIPLNVSAYISAFFVLSFILLFLGNVLSFYAFERYSEQLYETMEQNIVIIEQKKDLDYYMQIAELDKKQKEMIHNISNHMKMISRFAKMGDTSAILGLTGNINEEMEKDMLPIYCDNPILNSLLNEKKEEAEKQGVVTEFYVEPGVMLDRVSAADLISMIGNLFDNAIRAATEAEEEKYIRGFIYMKAIGGFCIVKITNTFKDVLYGDDGEFLTTKKEKGMHGLGIHSVNRIAEQYGGYLTCTVKEKEFEALLLISTDEDD